MFLASTRISTVSRTSPLLSLDDEPTEEVPADEHGGIYVFKRLISGFQLALSSDALLAG